MIIEIFITFTALAFILAIVGYIIDNELLMIFGFLAIGLMSFPLIQQDLEFRTGENITITNNNSTLFCSNQVSSVINGSYSYDLVCDNSTKEVKVNTYTNYTDTIWFGIFFIFICFSGMFTLYRDYYKKEKGDYD